MNGSVQSAASLVAGIEAGIANDPLLQSGVDFLVCPASVHISGVKDAAEHVLVGGQDCSNQDDGAYTGQVSAAMLKDIGCKYVVLGHSERRQYQEESDSLIAEKAQKALASGLVCIVCVGESEQEREAGHEKDIVGAQLRGSIPAGATADNMVIAYEPVWAIGTGKVASAADVAEMHAFIRGELEALVSEHTQVRILYGGSMNEENAKALLSTPNVDGGLIGGASLTADKFINIGKAAF